MIYSLYPGTQISESSLERSALDIKTTAVVCFPLWLCYSLFSGTYRCKNELSILVDLYGCMVPGHTLVCHLVISRDLAWDNVRWAIHTYHFSATCGIQFIKRETCLQRPLPWDYSGPCILRLDHPFSMFTQANVVLNGGLFRLIAGLKMQGIVKWRGLKSQGQLY